MFRYSQITFGIQLIPSLDYQFGSSVRVFFRISLNTNVGGIHSLLIQVHPVLLKITAFSMCRS